MRKTLALLLIALCGAVAAAQQSTPTSSRFALTVDSIMRGPKLVGYSPSDLRWSGDSKQLYFEWRMPGEDEAATWVVAREGGAPRRLSDDERRTAPLSNGTWDRERRRILGVDRGDIVVIDTVAGTRREITRTTGNESGPRWARGGTHVTFIRDNNLFVVPLEGSSSGTLVQLTDVSARRNEPRPTDSQRILKQEELKLLDWVEQEAERRKRREARDRARAAEVRARRAAVGGRRRAVRGRRLRVPRRCRSRPAADGASAAFRQRVGLHRGDHGADESGRCAGSTAAGGAEPEER